MSSPTTRQQVIDLCDLIATTCEEDAGRLDGTPFTGKAVAEKLGEILANQMAIAKVIKALAELGQSGGDQS